MEIMKIKEHRDRLDELEKDYNESLEEAIYKDKHYAKYFFGAKIVSKSKIDELETHEEELYKMEELRFNRKIDNYQNIYNEKIEELEGYKKEIKEIFPNYSPLVSIKKLHTILIVKKERLKFILTGKIL